MNRNVGSKERYARLAIGAAAGAAAMRTNGWQRAALGAVAAAGIGTGLTRYCPVNQAMGRSEMSDDSLLEQGLRDTELRRETSTRAALGIAPSAGSGSTPVTASNDMFGSTESGSIA